MDAKNDEIKQAFRALERLNIQAHPMDGTPLDYGFTDEEILDAMEDDYAAIQRCLCSLQRIAELPDKWKWQADRRRNGTAIADAEAWELEVRSEELQQTLPEGLRTNERGVE